MTEKSFLHTVIVNFHMEERGMECNWATQEAESWALAAAVNTVLGQKELNTGQLMAKP